MYILVQFIQIGHPGPKFTPAELDVCGCPEEICRRPLPPMSGPELAFAATALGQHPLPLDSRPPSASQNKQQGSQDHRGSGYSLAYSYAGRLEPKLDSVFAGRRYHALKHQVRQ